jgi:hypothetical protein
MSVTNNPAFDGLVQGWETCTHFFDHDVPVFFTETVPAPFIFAWDATTETVQDLCDATTDGVMTAWNVTYQTFEGALNATSNWVNEYVQPFFETSAQWLSDNGPWLWPVVIASAVTITLAVAAVFIYYMFFTAQPNDPAVYAQQQQVFAI